MKLRNKKTNEIVDVLISAYGISGDVAVSVRDPNMECGYLDLERYKTLAKLNEEWEDYKSTEPLIKDEKIRDIIRLWTKVNGVVGLTYNDSENSLTDIFRNEISFNGWLGLKDGCFYTTNELCGEEEE